MEYLQQFGIRYLLMTRLPQPRERIAPHMLICVWPIGWLQHYDRSFYYREDPVAGRCLNSLVPFLWSDHADDAETPLARQIMHEASEFGMSNGYCIPVHDVSGLQAVVTLAGATIDLPPRARRAAQLVGIYAFGVLDLRPPIDRREQLSPRERDALSFAAHGRSASEIAEAMGISATTVIGHLKQARGKLDAANTTHAVVQAIRSRQISI